LFKKLLATLGLCVRCGIPSARNTCSAFDKDKYLEPMFGDIGQPKLGYVKLSRPAIG